MIKKLGYFVLCISIVLCTGGCSKNNEIEKENDMENILPVEQSVISHERNISSIVEIEQNDILGQENQIEENDNKVENYQVAEKPEKVSNDIEKQETRTTKQDVEKKKPQKIDGKKEKKKTQDKSRDTDSGQKKTESIYVPENTGGTIDREENELEIIPME